jgi:hypothetical protein
MSREATLAQIAAAKGLHPRALIVERVMAFEATYARKDWRGRATLLAEDVIFEDTVGVPPPAIGRAAAEDYFRLVIGLGWTIEMIPERIVVMGDEAFVLTHAAWAEPGTPIVHVDLIHNFRFNARGEIAHVRIAYDEGCIRPGATTDATRH